MGEGRRAICGPPGARDGGARRAAGGYRASNCGCAQGMAPDGRQTGRQTGRSAPDAVLNAAENGCGGVCTGWALRGAGGAAAARADAGGGISEACARRAEGCGPPGSAGSRTAAEHSSTPDRYFAPQQRSMHPHPSPSTFASSARLHPHCTHLDILAHSILKSARHGRQRGRGKEREKNCGVQSISTRRLLGGLLALDGGRPWNTIDVLAPATELVVLSGWAACLGGA